MDSGSEFSEKRLKIHLLPGVFGPGKVKKTETDTHSESGRAKMPNFSNLFSFQRPFLMS